MCIRDSYTAKDGYNRGNETNASKWDEYCRDNNAVSYTFSSKEQMLASGILEKGDIIYMEPADWNHSNSDCHIGFFWGSNSSEDLFWHSSSHADGIVKGYFPNSAGGNVISKITPKYPVRYYRVIKTLHKGYLCLLYTSDAADDLLCVDLGGRSIIKKKNIAQFIKRHER